jgi:maltose phosphorylase
MRIVEDKLSFAPRIPEEWKSYSFKVNFRNRILKVTVGHEGNTFELDGKHEMSIRVNGKRLVLNPSPESLK